MNNETAASEVPQYTHKRTFLTVGYYAIQKSLYI